MAVPIDRIHDHLLPPAVPVSEVNRYHRNPRQGDVAAVAESLRQSRLEGVLRRGWGQIAVTWLDVVDDAAARIVVVDNRTS